MTTIIALGELHRAFHHTNREIARLSKPDAMRALSATTALLLHHLDAHGSTQVSELNRSVRLGSNVTYNVKLLKDLEYVTVETPAGDRRVRFVTLTPKGLAALRDFMKLLRSVDELG